MFDANRCIWHMDMIYQFTTEPEAENTILLSHELGEVETCSKAGLGSLAPKKIEPTQLSKLNSNLRVCLYSEQHNARSIRPERRVMCFVA